LPSSPRSASATASRRTKTASRGSAVFLSSTRRTALAAGALLAYAEVENLWLTIRRTAASPLVTIAAFLVLALSSVIVQVYEWRIISSSATIILTASVILSVSMVEKNKLLDWLAWTPIRYCGRISYGIYVYHFFVPMLILLAFPNFETIFNGKGGGIVRLAFLSVVTLLIAHFSWILIERPLLSMRDKQRKIGHNEREKIRISTPT
jgi:peptidoglycan/LPS O-acetylase OafA/YrhL